MPNKKRLMETDNNGIQRQFYPITNIDSVDDLFNVLVLGKPIIKQSSCDFKGKVKGNTNSNPHKFMFLPGETLLEPNIKWWEAEQEHYDGITALNGHPIITQTKEKDQMWQILLVWDLVADVDRQYPTLYNHLKLTTHADRVKWLINHATQITPTIWASGSGATGEYIDFRVYYRDNLRWNVGPGTNSGSIYRLSIDMENTWYVIQDDGCVYCLAYAPKSDGNVPSVINLDYANLRYTLAFDTNL
ncbi:hypothetical protein [Melissococcus plutonius]|uniref:hypothetical protein n=1 Tax=Melissococcus plutonius TaxID=33970 RepID=UPI003C2F85DE